MKKRTADWPLIIVLAVWAVATPFYIYMAWQNDQIEKGIEQRHEETLKTLHEIDSMMDESIEQRKRQLERIKNEY